MPAETLFGIFCEFLDDFESTRILAEKRELAVQRERRLSLAKQHPTVGSCAIERASGKDAAAYGVCQSGEKGGTTLRLIVPRNLFTNHPLEAQRGVVDDMLASLRSGQRIGAK